MQAAIVESSGQSFLTKLRALIERMVVSRILLNITADPSEMNSFLEKLSASLNLPVDHRTAIERLIAHFRNGASENSPLLMSLLEQISSRLSDHDVCGKNHSG
jgi:hypothetical protein